jgi:hypothetical protein
LGAPTFDLNPFIALTKSQIAAYSSTNIRRLLAQMMAGTTVTGYTMADVQALWDSLEEALAVLEKGGGDDQEGRRPLSRTRSFIRFSELESLSVDMIRWLVT